MDIQFIGDHSTALTIYLTKYILKNEKSGADNLFENIKSSTSLCSRLWNVAMRMLSHRECGSMEAADTCLGFSLYGTDAQTVIRWLNIFEIRGKKIKPLKDIQHLDDDSTNIFHPHFIDDYYANRPQELEHLCLYEFASWYDVQSNEPKLPNVEYYVIGNKKFLKKRQKKILVNHYKFKCKEQPEQYFYGLLLLFKPWRSPGDLKGNYNTYAEGFLAIKDELPEAIKYHEKLCNQESKLDEMKILIEEENLKEGIENDDVIEEVLGCVPLEFEQAMNDFEGVMEANNEKNCNSNVENLIKMMNVDQKRIVDKVMKNVASENDICQLFVTGET